ncbi:hypothetical protein [Ligilactobacillus ceti]|uniref:Uncharacterized protein n=1 Tax=Ligilactobacillus ceti DSM 22408 TaxID=1122146 RepID=A0A0R2KIS6_9LACO|nr:hypothetical protein [Ligilactobacillus ceti]KRN89233.1 hypothetical protein IV53_GL000146 [Ligilactobacillus ceti DSM 22408]
MQKNNKKALICFLIGLILVVISYFLPENLLMAFTNLRPFGLATIIIAPFCGLFGIGYAIKEKAWLLLFLNLILINSFPIYLMFAYYLATPH